MGRCNWIDVKLADKDVGDGVDQPPDKIFIRGLPGPGGPCNWQGANEQRPSCWDLGLCLLAVQTQVANHKPCLDTACTCLAHTDKNVSAGHASHRSL